MAFLRQHTQVLLLSDPSGAQVALGPAYQGRVMTSTTGGTTGGTTGTGYKPNTWYIPNSPFAMTATAASSSSLKLNWYDNADNEAAFVIERANASGRSVALFLRERAREVLHDTRVGVERRIQAETAD